LTYSTTQSAIKQTVPGIAWADSYRDALFDEWRKLNPTL